MNWVAPIKDKETLDLFGQTLKDIDYKYYIMFELGIGTGLQLQDILSFRNKDVTNKEEMLDNLGSDKTNISPEPTVEDVKEYTETVVDDMLTDENNNTPVWFNVLFKIIPVSLVLILLVGIGALFYIKKKNNE